MKRIVFFIFVILLLISRNIYTAANTYTGIKVSAIVPIDNKGIIFSNQMFNFSGATQWQTSNPSSIITDTEVPNLINDADGSSLDTSGNYGSGRFADANNYFIYRLVGFKTNLYRVDLRIGNNFKVGIMRNTGGTFYEELNSFDIFNDDIHDLSNMMYQTIDLNYYLQTAGGTVYLKVVDGSTSDGWGGKCGALWMRKLPSYQNGETIKFKVFTDKSNHIVTADFSRLGGGIVNSDNNGSVTNMYPISFTIPDNFNGHNLVYSIPITLYNPSYSPDTYTTTYIVYINNPIVGYITNNRYSEDYIYGWNRGESGISIYETSALYDDNGSAINGNNERYADGTSYFTYKFTNIIYDLTKLKIEASQNYKISISKDNNIWYEIATSTNEWGFQGGNNEINKWEYEYYVKDYIGSGSGDLYVKFNDLSTSDGWGVVSSYLKLFKVPVYKNGETINLRIRVKYGYNITSAVADFSSLDSNGTNVSGVKNGDTYTFTYNISQNNSKGGLFSLPIKLNLSTGGYRYYYYKIGINYIYKGLMFDSVSLESNTYKISLDKLIKWSKLKISYSSNIRAPYNNMNFYTETENSCFNKNLTANIPYYFGILGTDENLIESSNTYYMALVKINENSDGKFYFYNNNSFIEFDKESIYGDTVVYFNYEEENLPSGIDGIAYYRIEYFNKYNNTFQKPYKVKLYYSNDIYDSKKLTVYHLSGNRWERLVTSMDTSGTGGYLSFNTISEGWFVIAEDKGVSEKNYVESTGFSPNGDGINDDFRFLIPLEEDSKVSIKIYNLKGILVRILQPEIVATVPGIEIRWDGRDDNGDNVPAGVYIYKIKVNDKIIKGILGLIR